MNLTDEQRKAIMGWLEVIKGGKEMVKKVNVRLGGRTGERKCRIYSPYINGLRLTFLQLVHYPPV
jgi:hypothetical protein